MNINVCFVTFIFLSLENVTSCEKPGDHDLEGTHSFTCVSQKSSHQWYQGYQNKNGIGAIPPQTGVKTTRFIIKVEEFDNNTNIYCNNTSPTWPAWTVQVVSDTFSVNKSILYNISKKPIVTNKVLKKKEDPAILKYNEKQNVSFSCLEHINKTTYIQLGIINTISNLLVTSERNSTLEIFNIMHNGTILCCVYYLVNGTADEKWITREVASKTLLLYSDIVQQDALGENFSNTKRTNYINADPGHQTIVIIITAAVAIVFILIVTIVICRKRCQKKPQLDTKVLYADLDFLRQIEPDSLPRPSPEEESPYAEIIGVMRPQTKPRVP